MKLTFGQAIGSAGVSTSGSTLAFRASQIDVSMDGTLSDFHGLIVSLAYGQELGRSAMRNIVGAGFALIQVLESCEVAAARPSDDLDPNNYRQISLFCPGSNGGVLEAEFKAPSGANFKLLGRFQDAGWNAEIETIEFELISGFDETGTFVIDLRKQNSDEDKALAEQSLNFINPIMRKVCHGSMAQKERFQEEMRKNAEQ